jgi:hypothetical protein
MREQDQHSNRTAPEDRRVWVKPVMEESDIDALTELNPFNGVPTPHDANSLQYS